MVAKYNGTYKKTKKSFNWVAFVVWIISLIISLIPMYFELIKYINAYDELDIQFLKNCCINGDLMWAISTLLLFSLTDFVDFYCKQKKKSTNIENKYLILLLLGIVVFVIGEGTFLLLSILEIKETAMWPLYFCLPIIILSLVIATPLKIRFIKED